MEVQDFMGWKKSAGNLVEAFFKVDVTIPEGQRGGGAHIGQAILNLDDVTDFVLGDLAVTISDESRAIFQRALDSYPA